MIPPKITIGPVSRLHLRYIIFSSPISVYSLPSIHGDHTCLHLQLFASLRLGVPPGFLAGPVNVLGSSRLLLCQFILHTSFSVLLAVRLGFSILIPMDKFYTPFVLKTNIQNYFPTRLLIKTLLCYKKMQLKKVF